MQTSKSQNHNESMLADKAYTYVVKNITSGQFPPDSKISDRDIAKQLDISHLTVREAMGKLEENGWITRIHQKGSFIRNFTEQDFDEIFIHREVVEITAARILCEKVTTEQLLKLQTLVDQLEAALAKEDSKEYEEIDMQFHKSIVQFSNNRRLIRIFDSLILQSRMAVAKLVEDTLKLHFAVFGKDFEWKGASHRDIYGAISSRKPEETAQLIKSHIHDGYYMISSLKKIRKNIYDKKPI